MKISLLICHINPVENLIGAYAGKAAKLKSLWLRPDGYNLEIRAAGYAPYAERIYLMPGKTMHVKVDLVAAPKS